MVTANGPLASVLLLQVAMKVIHEHCLYLMPARLLPSMTQVALIGNKVEHTHADIAYMYTNINELSLCVKFIHV